MMSANEKDHRRAITKCCRMGRKTAFPRSIQGLADTASCKTQATDTINLCGLLPTGTVQQHNHAQTAGQPRPIGERWRPAQIAHLRARGDPQQAQAPLRLGI
jgi:hypothetical protein